MHNQRGNKSWTKVQAGVASCENGSANMGAVFTSQKENERAALMCGYQRACDCRDWCRRKVRADG